MPKLTDIELAEFLDEREHLARIGTIDESAQPYRQVTVRSVAEIVHRPGTDDQPRALCAIDLDAPTTPVSTWRIPVAGEDRRGVWAKRYYLPGTKWSDS